MAEFSHMGKAADAAISFMFTAIVVMIVSVPLAIWKIVDIVMWLIGNN
jgi:hypothetical protein